MTYELYCQLINTVLLIDTQQVHFLLRDVEARHGEEVGCRVRKLYQTNVERDSPMNHVELCSAVCTELLCEVTLSRLMMSLYFMSRYVAMVQAIEQPSKDALAIMRVGLSDELKIICKCHAHTSYARPLFRVPWSSLLAPACGVAIGVLGYFTYQMF